MANMVEIWRGYQLFSSTSAVPRKGVELCGMTLPTPDDLPDVGDSFATRGESDLEHQAKTAWLVLAFLSTETGIFELPVADKALWSLVTAALCHDVGELEIGDIPDDGNSLHGTKDEAELKVFDKLACSFPSEWRDRVVNDYRRFQKKNDNGNGQALYVVDKLEAVLMQLFYEKHGCPGRITAKPVPTDSDKYYMEITGSESSADCWAAHFYAHIQSFPERVKNPALELLNVAVRDVRGEPFAWWGKEILPYGSQ